MGFQLKKMILFWNVRDINIVAKQKRLSEKIKLSKVSLVCLLETHVLRENQKRVVNRIFPNCTYVDNYDHARLGRIWILFAADVRLHVQSCSSQAMHCHVFLEGGREIFLFICCICLQ